MKDIYGDRYAELLAIRAKAAYQDRMKRAAGNGWPSWEELDESAKAHYFRSSEADLLAEPPGPWLEFAERVLSPLVIPTLNWLTRQIDKANDWLQARIARRTRKDKNLG